MKLASLLERLHQCPVIVSVQASPGSPLDHSDTLLRLARASLGEDIKMLRLEGVKSIRTIRPVISAPIIGLLKRKYPDSDVVITPAAQDVDALLDLNVEVIAIDGTARQRPKKAELASLIKRIQRRGSLAMADCDTVENALAAEAAGADVISTTLAGYTPAHPATLGPDLEMLRAICSAVKIPVIAEGRFTQKWEIETAMRMGAIGVVVGGAINDPVKQTRSLKLPSHIKGQIGAVDIGGTWLRFGTFDGDWKLINIERVENPKTREERIAWIKQQIEQSEVSRIGVSTGGIVDAKTGEVWAAKEYLMHDHIGIKFNEETLGVPTYAFGDGHATAWGHACLPQFAGRRVATLALGTGVGCGLVFQNKIWCGKRGEYPRVNDLPAAGGKSYEELLGGIHLTKEPTEEQKANALEALKGAIHAIENLYFPDDLIVGGSVGLSPWLAPHLQELGAVPSPFDHDAGLYGAAALALYPDWA